MSRYLVIGKTGQVATALKAVLKDALFIGREELDLSKPEAVRDYLHKMAFLPEVIINAAAYTAVDKAEAEQELCNNINNISVSEIANFCAIHHITLVHYSTDYVFDGSGTYAFDENNIRNLAPLNIYGKTKLAGELAIINSHCKYYILRTSWVYSEAGNNFVKTMLRLAKERDELKIVSDQIGSPTYAGDIAKNTLKLLSKNLSPQILHFVPNEQISWYEFSKMIIPNTKITPIPSSDYPMPAKRPLNSRLSVAKLNSFGISFPTIRESLNMCLSKLDN